MTSRAWLRPARLLGRRVGIVLLWVAAIITIYTCYDYFRAGLRHVVDE